MAKMIKVLNKVDYLAGVGKLPPSLSPDAVYIGRPSPLGNPYKIGPDGTREEVIEKYRDWLGLAMSNVRPSEQFQKMQAEFVRLCINYELDGELTLMCWCAPLACHGDVLAELIERACKDD